MSSVAASSPIFGISYPQTHHCFGKLQRLQFVNPFAVSRRASNVTAISLRRATCFALQGDGGFQTITKSGGGDILSQPSDIINGEKNVSAGTMLQGDDVAVGTNVADVASANEEFSSYDDEHDLDYPTEGFTSIPEAIEDIRQGKFVIVVDDEDRENEGDLIMAASKVTPDAMAFIVRHGTGIVCVSMKGEDLERLQLPLMVTTKENEEKLCTAFTVSVDAKVGTTTGVSAKDGAKTVLALASPSSRPEDFNRPGHIFPLKYREGGVLKRAGHTEASVDLTVLAGLEPAAVLCELVDNDDGSTARLPKLREFAKKENLKSYQLQI